MNKMGPLSGVMVFVIPAFKKQKEQHSRGQINLIYGIRPFQTPKRAGEITQSVKMKVLAVGMRA